GGLNHKPHVLRGLRSALEGLALRGAAGAHGCAVGPRDEKVASASSQIAFAPTNWGTAPCHRRSRGRISPASAHPMLRRRYWQWLIVPRSPVSRASQRLSAALIIAGTGRARQFKISRPDWKRDRPIGS